MARLTLATANDELSYLGYAELGYRFEKHYSGRGYCLVAGNGFITARENTLKATFESALSYLSNHELVGQHCELTCELPESTVAVEVAEVLVDDSRRFSSPTGDYCLMSKNFPTRAELNNAEYEAVCEGYGFCNIHGDYDTFLHPVEYASSDLPAPGTVITTPQNIVVPGAYRVRESILVAAINHIPTLLSQGYKLYQDSVEFVTPLLFLVALMVKDAQQLVVTWLEYYNEPELVLVEPLSRYGVTQRSHLDVYYDTLSDVVTPTVCKLLELRLRLAWWLSR